MAAIKLEYIEGVLYTNNIEDIAFMLEDQIRKEYKNVFETEERKVFYDGEIYKVYADVKRYDDDFHVTVYVYDIMGCISDSICGDIEDILNESFELELCENTNDIYNEERI